MAVHREKINLYKTVKKIFPKILIKDLDEGEVIIWNILFNLQSV